MQISSLDSSNQIPLKPLTLRILLVQIENEKSDSIVTVTIVKADGAHRRKDASPVDKIAFRVRELRHFRESVSLRARVDVSVLW